MMTAKTTTTVPGGGDIVEEERVVIYYYISASNDEDDSSILPYNGSENPFMFVYGELDNAIRKGNVRKSTGKTTKKAEE